MITIRFANRAAKPNQVKIGMETDQDAEKIRFLLPQIGDNQVATLMMILPDGETPEALIIRDGVVNIGSSITEQPGRIRAWVDIVADGIAWNSELFYLDVGDLPPLSEQVERKYPTAIQEALEFAANAEQAAADVEAAKAAAEAARDAAQAAAGDFQGLSATAGGLAAGAAPTVNVTHNEGGLYNLAFGIPKGDKGDKGDATPIYTIQIVSSDISINASSRMNGKVAWKVLKQEGGNASSVAKEYGYHEYRLSNSQSWTEAEGDDTDVVFETEEYSNDEISGIFPTHIEIRFGREYIDGELQVLATTTVAITTQGQMGRNFYYAGEYSATTPYKLTDFEAPFVSLTENGQTTYWVMFGNNGTIVGVKPSSTSNRWRLMSSNFTYLITQAVFSNFAKLGSAVFNLDYMFSQQGVMKGYGGVATQVATGDSQYQHADPEDMNGDNMDDVPISGKSDYTGDSSNPNPYVTGLIQAQNTFIPTRLNLDANKYYTIEMDFQANSGIVVHGALAKTDSQYTEVGYAELTTTDNNPNYDRLCLNARTDESGNYCIKIINTATTPTDVLWIKSYRIRECKFAPSLFINLKTGEMTANDITARGLIYADGVYHEQISSNSNNDVIPVGNATIVSLGNAAVNARVVLPAPSTCKGRTIDVYSESSGNWYLSWVGANTTSTFLTGWGTTSFRTSASLSGYYYVKVYSDGTNWRVLAKYSE